MGILGKSKQPLLIFCFLLLFPLMIGVGVSQAYSVRVWFDNRTNQYLENDDGYYFIIDLRPSYVGELDSVDYVTAVNTNPALYSDYETYYFDVVFTGNNVLEIVSDTIYTGQGGLYEVTIHFDDGSTAVRTTGYIAPRSNPILIPKNLHVDFSPAYVNPTLTFSSVDDATVDEYRFGFYIEPWRDRLLASPISHHPEDGFTYYPIPNQGGLGGTGEALQVGKIYLLRAEAYDLDTDGGGFYRSFSYLAFLIPDPSVHYTLEYIRNVIKDEGSEIPVDVRDDLLVKVNRYNKADLNSFIIEVSALKGKRIYRWVADILIQCAKGLLERTKAKAAPGILQLLLDN